MLAFVLNQWGHVSLWAKWKLLREILETLFDCLAKQRESKKIPILNLEPGRVDWKNISKIYDT